MFNWLLPAKAANQLVPEEHQVSAYSKYRTRVFLATILGYTLYYIVKANFTLAAPYLISTYHFSKADIGIVLSFLAVSYGIGKFLMGTLADKLNPRYFLPIGLIGSAVFNIGFGQTDNLWVMCALMTGVGVTQGIGAPCCQKMLATWFDSKILGTATCFWNTSHNIGSGTAAILVAGIVSIWGVTSLDNIFLVPSIISIIMALIIAILGVDTPSSVGLPEVNKVKSKVDTNNGNKSSLVEDVLKSPIIWLMCILNALSYILRYGILNWIPVYLASAKGFSATETSLAFTVFEYAAIPGTILLGLLSDRVLKGKRLPITIATSITILIVFPIYLMTNNITIVLIELAIMGICVYGQQVLIGIVIMQSLPVNAVASGIGLSGFFGYAFGEVIASYGIGVLVGKDNWSLGFSTVIISAILCSIICIGLNRKFKI